MKNLPSIGIIGGAGPEGGALLFKQIIQVCQHSHSCHRDHDFPLIHLLSYPFSEMLGTRPDREKIQSQLKDAYNQLQTDYVVIACNTLHAFIDDSFRTPRFIHLFEETKSKLKSEPLVLCSSTSMKAKIHQSFFNCIYPNETFQLQVDSIIDAVLAGNTGPDISKRLSKIIEHESDTKEVVLGCTEFSVVHDTSPIQLDGWDIIDPSLNAAKKVCKLVFKNHTSPL